MAWREELHPRDGRGRFTFKGSTPAVSIKDTLQHLENLDRVSDDDIFDVFHRLSQYKKLDERNLGRLTDELARREGLKALPPPDDTPEQKHIDTLVSRGYSYAEAYEETYGAVTGKRAQDRELSAQLGRRSGESLEQARRRAYQELVALQMLQAEEATRGHLLAKQCAQIDRSTKLPKVNPASLWSMPVSRARRCASEDLQRWWEANGGRQTYADFKTALAGGKRSTGEAGRDFGL